MPEGHTIKHLATVLSYGFVGTTASASSPQGRFAEGATRIDGREVTDVTCKGKHLFLHFDDDIVHIHLGLYGWIHNKIHMNQPYAATTRLRLINDLYSSDVVGPAVCEIFTPEQYAAKLRSLGEDPLRDDADPEAAWLKIKKSKKEIGVLLMDQSIIAGIGNIYRAELLFLANQSPFILGKYMEKERFYCIWEHAVRLFALGAEDGCVRTVAKEHLYEEELGEGKYNQSSYVYKRASIGCRVCHHTTCSQKMAGRTLYFCPWCQV